MSKKSANKGANADAGNGTPAEATPPAVKDVEFTRTDETLRYRWEDTLKTLKAGESMTFEGHKPATVRERSVQFTRKTGIVLECGVVGGVPTVRRPAK